MERIKEVKEIKLLESSVLVEIFEKRKTASGIILPENSTDVMRHGIIIGRGSKVPEEYAMEDVVLDYNKQGANFYLRDNPDGNGHRKFMLCTAFALKLVIAPSNFDNSKDPVFRGSDAKKK